MLGDEGFLSYLSNMWSLAIQGELQGMWFWSATYAILVCGYSIVSQLKIRSWPGTRGLLTKASVSKFGYTQYATSDQEYRADAHYSYTVANQDYEGRRVSPWIIVVSHNLRFILKMQLSAVKPTSTGMVEVFYNPNRPEKSYLIQPSKLGIWVTFMLGVGPTIAYVHRYYF